MQLWALRDAAALFLHNVFDSCAFEGRELDGGVLLGGRNARVAVGGQRSTYWPSKRFREIMYSLAHAVVPESILQFGEGWRIDPADGLIQALRDQFGRENVFLQYR